MMQWKRDLISKEVHVISMVTTVVERVNNSE